jgi:hypothetical protein
MKKPFIYYLRASKRGILMWFKRLRRGPPSLERTLKKRWVVKDSTPIPQYRAKFVVNRLGKAFLRHEYPKWVHWDCSTPNTFYINVDMLFPMLDEDEKDTSKYNFHRAWINEQVARNILDEVIKDKIQPDNIQLYFHPEGEYGWYKKALDANLVVQATNKARTKLKGKFK